MDVVKNARDALVYLNNTNAADSPSTTSSASSSASSDHHVQIVEHMRLLGVAGQRFVRASREPGITAELDLAMQVTKERKRKKGRKETKR